MLRLLRTGLAGCALALVLLAGCGDGKKVLIYGLVLYENKPVENGTITFQPTEATGNPAAGAVSDGKFAVQLIPGKYKVTVASTPSTDNANGPARSYEEYKARQINPAEMMKMQRASRDEQKKYANKVEGTTSETIPPNAPGNDVTLDIKPNQDITLSIRKPK